MNCFDRGDLGIMADLCIFFLKDVIAELLDDIDKHHWCFFPVLQCLHVLTKNLPQHPLGKKVVSTISCQGLDLETKLLYMTSTESICFGLFFLQPRLNDPTGC